MLSWNYKSNNLYVLVPKSTSVKQCGDLIKNLFPGNDAKEAVDIIHCTWLQLSYVPGPPFGDKDVIFVSISRGITRTKL